MIAISRDLKFNLWLSLLWRRPVLFLTRLFIEYAQKPCIISTILTKMSVVPIRRKALKRVFAFQLFKLNMTRLNFGLNLFNSTFD